MSYGLVELGFVFGIALAFSLWELWSIRREIRRGRNREVHRQGPDEV
jgi:hypothetical protein